MHTWRRRQQQPGFQTKLAGGACTHEKNNSSKKGKTSWQHCKSSLSARLIQWVDGCLPFWSWQMQNQSWISQDSCCILRQCCPWSLHWKELDLIEGGPCFASNSWSNCCQKNWVWLNRAEPNLPGHQHGDNVSCEC